jgi:uroporphyrin-III C-methyltransferase/precorrin-2 dehydrogenase/sirohydrochlorin ferrochelatase
MSLRTAIQLGLETGELPLRRHRRASVGSVVLVGAGPGDPGLITTRGRRAMAEADVVVVDRLAPRALLAELDDDVEVIDAGKAPHAHTLSQTEINALLVDRARTGQRVVRLKGGDPYVLGRGGEEVRACRAAGVSVEVIPGVSSAIAGPAAAGIPVTHRGVAKAFAVVSGHDGPLDWANLATFDGTLVLLMGVSRLAEISAELARHGLAGTTPVALVEWATTGEERTTIATLDTVTDVAERAGVRAPAVIVVGDVVSLSHVLPFVATQ